MYISVKYVLFFHSSAQIPSIVSSVMVSISFFSNIVDRSIVVIASDVELFFLVLLLGSDDLFCLVNRH